MHEFRWNDWNVGHVAEHGISPQDAEWVVNHSKAPYPEVREGGKRLVIGQAESNEFVQVIYIYSPADVVYVIHARPLTWRERQRYRRRRR